MFPPNRWRRDCCLQWLAEDPEILKDVKAIVLHTRLGGTVLFRGPHRRQAEEMIKKGVGITAIHWGTGAETRRNPFKREPAGFWRQKGARLG